MLNSFKEAQVHEEDRRIRFEVEKELAHIRAATQELRETEGNHKLKLKAIEQER
jgi:hypothetical protein